MFPSVLIFLFVAVHSLRASECDNPPSQWLLCDDFESGGGDFDTWFAQSDFPTGVGTDDRGRVTLSSEHVHSGAWSLYMSAAESSGFQGASLDWQACDGAQRTNCALRSFDQLHFRVWVRFAEDHRYVHHFLNIGGSQPDDYWYHGTAGCLPDGALAMGTTVDFKEDSHQSFFYTYFPGMQCDTRCERYADVDAICRECAEKGLPTCTEQPQCCWGNEFAPDPPHEFPVGDWFCFEMMMKANTPGEHDGVMAYWVNDSLVHRVYTMLWRTSPTLALNRMRIQHYITTDDAQGFSNRVWFDDAVVSTEHIGPGPGSAVARRFRKQDRRAIRLHAAREGPVRFIADLARSGNTGVAVYGPSGKMLWRSHFMPSGAAPAVFEWTPGQRRLTRGVYLAVFRSKDSRDACRFMIAE
jgi:hypothetical protein